MKKLFILFSCCMLAIITITAQENRLKERKQKDNHLRGEVRKNLNLTDDQNEKMKSINKDFKEKASTLKSNDDMTRGDFKKEMKDLNEKRKSQIDATLTPDQKNKVKEMKEGKQKEMKSKSDARFQKMSEKLGLDEKQKVSIKANQEKTQAEIKTINENKSLSNEQKKEQIKSLIEKQKAFSKSVLTPEQMSKIENRKKERTEKR